MMNIIRDNEAGGLFMTPLLVDWKIRRCNQKGCTCKPNTIIAGAGDDIPVFGLCEDHFQMCNQDNDGGTINLEFDNFDAFKKQTNQPQASKRPGRPVRPTKGLNDE